MDENLKKEIDEIKNAVKEIKKTVDNIEMLEEAEIKHILTVKDMEAEELNNLDTLENLENKELDKLHKITPTKFKDVISWKSMVWDNCEEKIMNSTQNIVTYMCRITNKTCSFELCPKNKLTDDDNKTKN